MGTLGLQHLIHPGLDLAQVSPEMWVVLGFSFLVDGWVLRKTFNNILSTKSQNMSFIQHLRKIRDPTTLAVFMEDSAACLGVVIAMAGIGASQLMGTPIYDSIAGVGISCLLGGVGFYLARLNQQYLLGQSVESGMHTHTYAPLLKSHRMCCGFYAEITEGIRRILLARPAIESVHSIQSQWVGPYTFSYKVCACHLLLQLLLLLLLLLHEANFW